MCDATMEELLGEVFSVGSGVFCAAREEAL
jgi:hypothetical protein